MLEDSIETLPMVTLFLLGINLLGFVVLFWLFRCLLVLFLHEISDFKGIFVMRDDCQWIWSLKKKKKKKKLDFGLMLGFDQFAQLFFYTVGDV